MKIKVRTDHNEFEFDYDHNPEDENPMIHLDSQIRGQKDSGDPLIVDGGVRIFCDKIVTWERIDTEEEAKEREAYILKNEVTPTIEVKHVKDKGMIRLLKAIKECEELDEAGGCSEEEAIDICKKLGADFNALVDHRGEWVEEEKEEWAAEKEKLPEEGVEAIAEVEDPLKNLTA